MAVRVPVTKFLDSDRAMVKFTWSGLLNGDTGTPVEFSNYSQRTIQVNGTFGAAGSVRVEGSNDDEVTWEILTDEAAAALVFTASGIGNVAEMVEKIRPK